MQWEVEALDPLELQRLVLAAIDRDVLARQMEREADHRRRLQAFIAAWTAEHPVAGGGREA